MWRASTIPSISLYSSFKVDPFSPISSYTKWKRYSLMRSLYRSFIFPNYSSKRTSIDSSYELRRAGRRSSLKWERQNW
jgi:hypothetical protein